MTTTSKSALNVVFGTMTIGDEGREGVRVHESEKVNAILDTFQRHGHTEVDNARSYGGGSSEQAFGRLGWQKRGLTMETKLYPTKGKPMGWLTKDDYTLSAADVRKGLMDSLKALKADSIDTFYLHGPDRSIPLEETLAEVDKLHKEGYFTRFGVSNFLSWEVAKMCELSKSRGWIKPSMYQGIYNGLHRGIEAELLPCLRHYGIALYAFQPLAGGLLTGRYKRDTTDFEEGSRFDPKRNQGNLHHARYWSDSTFDAIELVGAAAKKHNLTEAECALRWLSHHSRMKRELGDAVIVGASSEKQLEQNLVDLEKGPLPEDVVKAFDEAYALVKGNINKYWH